jgi:hypothetical protein
VRNRDRLIGIGEPVLPRYERIAFEKALVAPQGQPPAAFVCPGHPLLDAVIDLTLERHRDLLRAARAGGRARPGHRAARAVLSGARHPGRRLHPRGERRVISKRMLYVEHRRRRHHPPRAVRALPGLPPAGRGRARRRRHPRPPRVRLDQRELEQQAQGYAIAHVVPGAPGRGARRKLELIAKTEAAVKDRLTKEITYWDHRAEQLKLQEQAGKPNAKLNSRRGPQARRRLQGRLQKRLET